MSSQLTCEGGEVAFHVNFSGLSSSIHVEVYPFSGTFPALTTHEVTLLRQRLTKLYRSLSGTIAFQTTEENLSLEVKPIQPLKPPSVTPIQNLFRPPTT
jgi:hypothetical protein